jgi:hypothetical protein
MLYLNITLKTLRVTHEYMHSMLGILFIFAFRLKDKLLEDVVIPRNNTAKKRIFEYTGRYISDNK